MAINPNVLYPTQTTAPSADYTYGGAQDITIPGDNTGTPWKAALLNDIFGAQQALLKSSGIVPSGTPEKVGASQYLQSIVELVSGRATAYNDSGVANAYVMDLRTGQQYAASLFIGLAVKFTPANDSTGAATIDYNGTVDALVDRTGGALVDGQLVAGIETTAVFDGSNWRLMPGGEVDLRCDLITHELTVDADYTLTPNQNRFGRIIIADATPTLTGPVNIVVASIRRTFFAHNTTAEILTFKTVSGAGITVLPGEARQLYCEGLNIVDPTTLYAQVAAIKRGLILLSTQVISSSTTNVDFIAEMDGTYDKYILEFSNVVPVAAAVMSARVYTGASTLESGAADYKTALATSSSMQLAANVSATVALGGLNGSIMLHNVNKSTQNTLIDSDVNYESTTGVVGKNDQAFSFQKTTVITGIRFYGATSNIASGTFRLYALTK